MPPRTQLAERRTLESWPSCNGISFSKHNRQWSIHHIHVRVISGDRKPQDVCERSRKIGKHGYHEHKLAKFTGVPCSFQIFPAVVDRCPCDDEGEDIPFGEGCGEKNPGKEDGSLGNEAEKVPIVWGARVRETDDLINGRNDDQEGEQDASQWWNVDPPLHRNSRE